MFSNCDFPFCFNEKLLTENGITNLTLFYTVLFHVIFTFSFILCNLLSTSIITIFSFNQMGQFYYSAKAFDVLERLDPNPEYWEGKRGACVGIFQMILAGREPK